MTNDFPLVEINLDDVPEPVAPVATAVSNAKREVNVVLRLFFRKRERALKTNMPKLSPLKPKKKPPTLMPMLLLLKLVRRRKRRKRKRQRRNLLVSSTVS